MKKRFWILLLATLILVAPAFAGEKAYAEENPDCVVLEGGNLNAQDYVIHASTVGSYLTETPDGYMRVQGYTAIYYDRNFKRQKIVNIPKELPDYGGFYETESNYYLVTGQENPDEQADVEVFRITKYDKDWKRIGSCSLYGANTYEPFRAGSCRMAHVGDQLTVRTCHTMYEAEDGYHHQASVTIWVDTKTMQIEDSETRVGGFGYVSHSFNQFIRAENGTVAIADHGDAYPRSILAQWYPADYDEDGDYGGVEVMEFPGELGDNTTGASVGGFEMSDNSLLVAGNSVEPGEDSLYGMTRNVFVAAVSRSDSSVAINWLTDFSEGEETASTPHLVKISDDRFMVLWARYDKVFYTFINGNAEQKSAVYSLSGSLSNCAPIVSDGAVVWYSWDDEEEIFYRIPVNDPANSIAAKAVYGHDYQWQSTTANQALMKCAKCGETITVKAPSVYSVYWEDPTDESWWMDVPEQIEPGTRVKVSPSLEEEFEQTYGIEDKFTIKVSDEEACALDSVTNIITFKKEGVYTVTVYPTYNPDAVKTFQITVGDPDTWEQDPAPGQEQVPGQELVPGQEQTPGQRPGQDKDAGEQIFGSDGTAFGKGASAETAEAAILAMKSDKDPAGTKYGPLQAKSAKQAKTSVTVTWKKVKGAKKYIVYGNKCGKKNRMQKQAATGKTSVKFTKVKGNNGKKAKVKKGTYYKFLVIAIDKNGSVISSSKVIHAATKGGKVGNVKKVTTKAKKNKVSLKKGKSFKLAAKAVPVSKKLKVKKHRGIAYESSNKKIATVSKKGVIKAKKKGKCYIYAYAQNGVAAKIKVTVK